MKAGKREVGKEQSQKSNLMIRVLRNLLPASCMFCSILPFFLRVYRYTNHSTGVEIKKKDRRVRTTIYVNRIRFTGYSGAAEVINLHG